MADKIILIVEDDRIVAEGIKGSLEDRGYVVLGPVAYGEESIETVKEKKPDLVLMDIMLKGEMNGIDAAVQIQSQYNIPVVYLTAFSDEDILSRAKATEPYGYILKPFEERDLYTTIEIAFYRHNMENRLRQAKDEWQRTFDAVPDLITVMDGKYRIVKCNKAMADRLGVTPEKAVGLTCYEHVHGTKEPPSFCPHAKSLADNRIHVAEVHEERLGGDFLISTSPLPDAEGRIAASVHIAHDITERKRAKAEKADLETKIRQAHKMEAIGTLAGGIAHDFNNIMGIIFANTELALQDTPEKSPVKQNLKEIQIASRRARDLIKQILAFSRRQEQDKIHLNMSQIIKEALKMLRSSLPATINIRHNIAPRMDTIFADPTQIHQIIMNLATNAFHAMEKDGGVLTVSLENTALTDEDAKNHIDLKPGAYVRLLVTDTGYGIDPEIMVRIFEPFYTTKKIGKGTGMGLAVVHGIVKDHGGDIIVESDPGKGTRVQVLLPAYKETEKIEIKSQDRVLRGNERVLFVDDEEDLISAAKNILFGLGYKVISEKNPLAALELFKKQPNNFDLVITDVTMPGMSGDRLAREMIRIRPDIPVIFCTGHSDRITEEEAMKIGVKAYVMKPYWASELAASIRDVIDRTKDEKPGAIKRILVVDDEEQMRAMIRKMLENAGYEVMEAPDGNVALWLFKEKSADLIISDLIMPEKEGLETIMELKQDFPDVKIIAISGGGQGDKGQYLDMAKKIGADSTLAKPFEQDELLKAVEALLKG